MINEHAICIKNSFTIEDVEYIVKKANRLGMSGREISRVYAEQDEDSNHIYFNVSGMNYAMDDVHNLQKFSYSKRSRPVS